ncbi:hypothetical protein SLEP1_g43087 [Rubroshorea leprosula]|uniref:Uncharacterized protein n=1 Tax=Rubroshorea leprosula TaxID=152421 RepID=A0AAV5LCF9_9ROSI|nr:hypothetical protein SLEP1_g43087 [Rubroshorea leprosula]
MGEIPVAFEHVVNQLDKLLVTVQRHCSPVTVHTPRANI